MAFVTWASCKFLFLISYLPFSLPLCAPAPLTSLMFLSLTRGVAFARMLFPRYLHGPIPDSLQVFVSFLIITSLTILLEIVPLPKKFLTCFLPCLFIYFYQMLSILFKILNTLLRTYVSRGQGFCFIHCCTPDTWKCSAHSSAQ